jgi:hypothetical protein
MFPLKNIVSYIASIGIPKAKNKFLGLVSTFGTFAAGGFILVVGILVRQAAESLVLCILFYTTFYLDYSKN